MPFLLALQETRTTPIPLHIKDGHRFILKKQDNKSVNKTKIRQSNENMIKSTTFLEKIQTKTKAFAKNERDSV